MSSESGSKDEEEVEYSPIENVYIDNKSDIDYMDFSDFAMFAGESFGKVQFLYDGSAKKDQKKAVDVIIEENEDEYAVSVSVPEWSEISHDDAALLNENIALYVDNLKVIDAVIKSGGGTADENDMMTALMPVNVEFTPVGDENVSIGAELVKMLGPLIIIFIMYFMILIFGQSIGKIIIAEKVSKLMETMLLSVKPYKLIAGKILAIVSIAVLQIVMWVIGIFAGIFIGDAVAENMNPGYSNIVFDIIDLIKESDALAFSVPSIIFALLAFITGFIFYCVLAGLLASPVSKAEELASSTGIFQMLVVIGFLLSYMLPLMEVKNAVLDIVLYIVPLTSAFMLPANVLIGNISLGAGVGYYVLLAASTIGVAIYAGKIYRNQVFYNNSSMSLIKKLFR